MLFEIAKSVEIVIILGKQLFYPKIVDFLQKHYSVATFFHINLPEKVNFFINWFDSALNIAFLVFFS